MLDQLFDKLWDARTMATMTYGACAYYDDNENSIRTLKEGNAVMEIGHIRYSMVKLIELVDSAIGDVDRLKYQKENAKG